MAKGMKDKFDKGEDGAPDIDEGSPKGHGRKGKVRKTKKRHMRNRG